MSAEHDETGTADPAEESLEALRAVRASRAEDVTRDDEANVAEDLELPGADLSGEELVVRIVPKMADEFTCTRCFLVAHQSQRVGGKDVCADCA